jgi:hypothetical protein
MASPNRDEITGDPHEVNLRATLSRSEDYGR